MSPVIITIRDPIDAEPKVYRKAVASDDELFALLDRAAAKYGAPPEPAPLAHARFRPMTKQADDRSRGNAGR